MLWKVTWPYFRQHKATVIGIVTLQFTATIAALFLPDLNASIIDQGVVTGDVARVWQLGGAMLAISAVQAVTSGFAVYLSVRLAMGLGADLRGRVFDHVQGLSAQEVHRFGAPSLITRNTNDIQQIQMVTLMIFNLIMAAPIMAIGGAIMALKMNVKLSGILLVIIPIIAVTIFLAYRTLAPRFRIQQDRLDAMNTVLREELSGIRVIRAFVKQDEIDDKYQDANSNLRQVALGIGAVFAVIFPFLQLVASAGSVAVIWFGARLIDAGEMEIGALLAYISYLFMIFGATMTASMMFFMLPRATVTARRVDHVLTTESSVRQPSTDRLRTVPEGPLDFRFENVTVQYPGAEEAVLHDINAVLRAGTTTAVIGSTGSGKSTLASLLPRLMDPSSGTITLSNGRESVRSCDVDLFELRDQIGFVPQNAYLFSGTIASTVSGAEFPSDEQKEAVRRALEGAQAAEFVSELEDGLDEEVEAGGANFSGGQRQRLTMARALYRKAKLYVFDDSFSALDYSTDAKIRNSLRSYVGDAAVLIVAQRVATIRHADAILVLDQGKIVACGTHTELLKTDPTYQEIVESQLTVEERA